MLRILIFFGVACTTAFVAVWIAEQSGHGRISWGGYLVEASAAVFFGLAIAAVVSSTLVFELTRIILSYIRKYLDVPELLLLKLKNFLKYIILQSSLFQLIKK